MKIHRRELLGVQRTRGLLRQWLNGWDLAGRADEEELLVSEVVTNGLVHGTAMCTSMCAGIPSGCAWKSGTATPTPPRP
ncbi:hypothetical protein [Streptomyces sp900116325]|uniref:hypothetical protein n=1 Tax=Streptomyces sp. 900116325 TaxID=3154295 RepID=UPI0033AE3812